MAVVQLYYHVAPRAEVNIVVKALIRLLRSRTEVQAVILSCIAAMSTSRQVCTFFFLQDEKCHFSLFENKIFIFLGNSRRWCQIANPIFQKFLHSVLSIFIVFFGIFLLFMLLLGPGLPSYD